MTGEIIAIARAKSDVEVARAARALLGTTVAAEGALWHLDGALWCRVTDAALHEAVVELDGQQAVDGETVTLSAGRLAGIMTLATQLDERSDHFSAAAPGVAVGEEWATVDASGVHREPLTPDHRSRFRLEAEPGALDEEPTMFLAQLRDMLLDPDGTPRTSTDEIVNAIGETIGLALIGRGATRDARHLLLVGPPNCGKSTLLAIISSLIPPEAQTAMTLHDLGERFRGAALVGARLVLCSELPARDLLDVERAKAALTGDPIQVERKHRDPTTIRPTACWVLAANGLPAAPDSSQAVFRRFLVVQLRRKFNITSRDFAADIIAKERGAIAGWALHHAAASLVRGSRLVPVECQGAAEEWARDSDPVIDWLAARTTRDPEATTTREAAWAAYRDYTIARGGKPVSFSTFRRRLPDAGIFGAAGRTGGLPLRLSTERDPLQLHGVVPPAATHATPASMRTASAPLRMPQGKPGPNPTVSSIFTQNRPRR